MTEFVSPHFHNLGAAAANHVVSSNEKKTNESSNGGSSLGDFGFADEGGDEDRHHDVDGKKKGERSSDDLEGVKVKVHHIHQGGRSTKKEQHDDGHSVRSSEKTNENEKDKATISTFERYGGEEGNKKKQQHLDDEDERPRQQGGRVASRGGTAQRTHRAHPHHILRNMALLSFVGFLVLYFVLFRQRSKAMAAAALASVGLKRQDSFRRGGGAIGGGVATGSSSVPSTPVTPHAAAAAVLPGGEVAVMRELHKQSLS